MRKKGLIGGIVLALCIILGLVLTLMCTKRIPAGYVGVVYNMNGGVDGEVLGQGWHIVSPTKKVTTYSVGIEQSYLTSADKGDSPNDESFSIPTSDGKTVRVNLEFSYRFDPDRVYNYTYIKPRSHSRMTTFWKKHSNRVLRRKKFSLPTQKGNQHRKVFDYWWEIF